MRYEEAVNYIHDIPKFTKKHDAEHTRTFLEYLGNPQEKLKVLHVAGAKGKGSVCAYLDGMLRSEGMHTGLFTSPHLVRINERIVLDGREITAENFCKVFGRTLAAARKMVDAGVPQPAFFGFLFGLAVLAVSAEGGG